MANKERVIPYTTESEYYPDGTQKRYYHKVERPYPQMFELIVGLSLVAIAVSLITIIFQQNQCRTTTQNWDYSQQNYILK